MKILDSDGGPSGMEDGMTPVELMVVLEQHARYLRGQRGAARANLTMLNLSGMDLSQAQLKEAKLTGSNLNRCVLKGADFSECDLFAIDLSGADLRGANLARAVLNDSGSVPWKPKIACL